MSAPEEMTKTPAGVHSTTLDMSDLGDFKKGSSQPLIRAIKEELLKLSQSSQGKTKITELSSEQSSTANC